MITYSINKLLNTKYQIMFLNDGAVSLLSRIKVTSKSFTSRIFSNAVELMALKKGKTREDNQHRAPPLNYYLINNFKILINKYKDICKMAQLEKKFFGRLKGSLGDVVFRSRNDKNYIAQKPKSYTPPSDPKFKERTGKFRVAVKLASTIYSIDHLKQIWNANAGAGKTAFNELVQVNYPFVADGNLTNLIKIVPKSSFGIKLQTLTMDDSTLNIELAALSELSNIDVTVEKQIQILAVIFLGTPINEALPSYEFINVSSSKQLISLSGPLTFSIPLLTADTDVAVNYSNKKVLFTALTFDENNSLVQYSSTVNYNVQ